MENTRDFRWVKASQVRDTKRWRENNRTSVWERTVGVPSTHTDSAVLLCELKFGNRARTPENRGFQRNTGTLTLPL